MPVANGEGVPMATEEAMAMPIANSQPMASVKPIPDIPPMANVQQAADVKGVPIPNIKGVPMPVPMPMADGEGVPVPVATEEAMAVPIANLGDDQLVAFPDSWMDGPLEEDLAITANMPDTCMAEPEQAGVPVLPGTPTHCFCHTTRFAENSPYNVCGPTTSSPVGCDFPSQYPLKPGFPPPLL